ncbi:signal peptidase II [Demequina sp.]|uniref:signal peptidase II n=1 Tax=Demequina sp. TaxID=2050685 RepID=UPI003D0DA40E
MTWRPALWLVALGVVLVDQASKQWALSTLQPGEVHEVLGRFLAIELVKNPGAALSLGENHTWIITAVGIAVSVAIIVYARRAQSSLAVWIFGIGLGGAVSNLIDRLFRAPGFGQGHVVDMINYNGWFVGNIADIAIVGAAIAFAVLAAFGVRLLEPAEPTEPAEPAEPASEATADAEASPASDGSA